MKKVSKLKIVSEFQIQKKNETNISNTSFKSIDDKLSKKSSNKSSNKSSSNSSNNSSNKSSKTLYRSPQRSISICERRGLKQIGPTCFFNSALNCLMLGQNSSKHLNKLYENLSSDDKTYINQIDITTCPRNISKFYVLKYMSEFFKEVNPNLQDGRELLHRLHSIKTIANDGRYRIYSIDSLIKILESTFNESEYCLHDNTLFINTLPDRNSKICVYYYKKDIELLMKDVPYQIGKHILDSCCIHLYFESGATSHAICGFRCENEFYIYDSNMNFALKINWSKGDLKAKLSNYVQKYYKDQLTDAGFSYILYSI